MVFRSFSTFNTLGLLIQFLVTSKPDDKNIELALSSLMTCVSYMENLDKGGEKAHESEGKV